MIYILCIYLHYTEQEPCIDYSAVDVSRPGPRWSYYIYNDDVNGVTCARMHYSANVIVRWIITSGVRKCTLLNGLDTTSYLPNVV